LICINLFLVNSEDNRNQGAIGEKITPKL